MFAAAIACAVLIIACGDRRSRSAEAKEPAPPAVASSNASPTPTLSEASPVVTGPVSYERADSAFRENRFSEAVSLFAVYTARRPDNPWGHYMLGLSAWRAGDRETAEQELQKTIALDSTLVKARLNLSRVLIETGRAKEAQDQLQAVLRLDSSSTSAYRLIGRAHNAVGETDAAIDAYKHAILLDSNDVWAMNDLALVYLERGRFEDAVKPLARAVEVDSSTVQFRNNLGLALERAGHYSAAANAFTAALAIDSNYVKASVSRTRVTGLKEDPSLRVVDLAALAQGFVSEVESWRKGTARQGN
jgi:tetratricopeptide (TPR) repeat protein